MPNWSYNHIVLQGDIEAVYKFVKIGLENSGLTPSGILEDDFNLLVNEGKTKFLDYKEKKIVMEKYLSARTFLPMPDTFLLYDTTNYPNHYPVEVVKEQQEKYGVIGWYDYNCKTLGTKWNFDLNENNDIELYKCKDKYRICFYCQTAWSVPAAWMSAVKDMVPELEVMGAFKEEGYEFACVSYINDGEFVEYSDISSEYAKLFSDHETAKEECEKKIRNDAEHMERLCSEFMEENGKEPDESDIDEIIDNEVNEEVGEFADTDSLDDRLESLLTELMDERM